MFSKLSSDSEQQAIMTTHDAKLNQINPFSPDNAKSKTDKFSKITTWMKLKNKQHYSKVLLNSFSMITPQGSVHRIKN